MQGTIRVLSINLIHNKQRAEIKARLGPAPPFSFHWFVLERRVNGQRQQPPRTQFRHDKSRIEGWRENPYKEKKYHKKYIKKSDSIVCPEL